MRFQCVQGFPLLNHGNRVFAWVRLSRDAGFQVDGRPVLKASVFCPDGFDDLVKLLQERVALSGNDFNGGNDVDHGAFWGESRKQWATS